MRRAAVAGGAVIVAPAVHDATRTRAAAASGGVTAATSLGPDRDLADLSVYTLNGAGTWSAPSGTVIVMLFQAIDDDDNSLLTMSVAGTGGSPPINAATPIAVNQFTVAAPGVASFAFWTTATGGAGTIDVTLNRAVNNLGWHFVELGGVDAASPVAQSKQAGGTGSPATASLTSPAAANGQLIFAGSRAALPAWGSPTPATYTTLADFRVGDGSDHSIATFFRPDAQPATDITHSGDRWGTISMELVCI